MDKSLIGLVAAIGAATPLAGAHAAIMTHEEAHSALRATSIAELLDPAPNAVAVLAALDSERAPEAASEVKGLQVAQWHHHHWHHHHWHHHHHHHHHHYYYHHHHHHHYRPYGCAWTPLGWVCP